MWPLKWSHHSKWGNFWLLYAVLSLIVVPFGLAFTVWPIVLLGGSLVNIGYAIRIISKNQGWGAFRQNHIKVLFPSAAELLWMGDIAVYSAKLPVSVCWACPSNMRAT